MYADFFSSRRRHTRYWRDWSSDVCSSDLDGPPRRDAERREHGEDDHGELPVPHREVGEAREPRHGGGCLGSHRPRSEERRVGKESRSRWSPYHSKKKKEKCTHSHLT